MSDLNDEYMHEKFVLKHLKNQSTFWRKVFTIFSKFVIYIFENRAVGPIQERVISNFEFKVQNTTTQNTTAMNYFNIKLIEISFKHGGFTIGWNVNYGCSILHI